MFLVRCDSVVTDVIRSVLRFHATCIGHRSVFVAPTQPRRVATHLPPNRWQTEEAPQDRHAGTLRTKTSSSTLFSLLIFQCRFQEFEKGGGIHLLLLPSLPIFLSSPFIPSFFPSGLHTERKTTSLAWKSLPYGPPAHTTAASTVLAGTIQERTRSTKSELEGRSQQRPTKDGVHLGGSRGGSS